MFDWVRSAFHRHTPQTSSIVIKSAETTAVCRSCHHGIRLKPGGSWVSRRRRTQAHSR